MGSSLPFASLLCLPRVALSSGVPGVNAIMVLPLSVVTLLHHGYLGSRCSAGAPWCRPRVSSVEGRLGWCLCPPPSPARGGPFLPGVTSCYPHKFPLGWSAPELPLVRVPYLLASPFEGHVPVTTVVFTSVGQTHTALTLQIGESKLLGAHLLSHFPPALSLLFSSPALAPRGRNHVHIYFAQTATPLEVKSSVFLSFKPPAHCERLPWNAHHSVPEMETPQNFQSRWMSSDSNDSSGFLLCPLWLSA